MDLSEAAPEHLRAFLVRLPDGHQTRISVLCDSDADGLPAGAILTRALQQAGYTSVLCTTRRKAESAWTPAVLDRLRTQSPQALFVLDLGSRPGPLLPGVPALLIDHHAPLGVPDGAELLTGYGVEPTPTTGLLVFWAVRGLVDEPARQQMLWLAAISLLSDLGEKAPFPELAQARARWRLKDLREATSLLNAPRRSASGDAQAALAALLNATDPRQIADAPALHEARAEVAAALDLARKAPPRFSTRYRDRMCDIVAIRMATPCQVHPLVAQTWRGRFKNSIVMGVNFGFRPGFVHFSARAPRSINLIQFLLQHRPEGADESYGSGHDQASGGALRNELWNAFAAGLGFGPELMIES